MADPATSSFGMPDESLPCPHCGYDLRGTVADRCSECGQTFDRSALSTSAIPWAHRRQIGRVRAYLKTVWLVTAGRRTLAYEPSRPQNPADARSFRRVTAAIIAIALLGVFFEAAYQEGGLAYMAFQPEPYPIPGMGGGTPLPGFLIDVLVPWSAGATIWPVLPIGLILLSIQLAGVQRAVFRLPGADALHRQRAWAVASYAAAPMALLLPAVVCVLAGPILARWLGPDVLPTATVSLALAGGALGLLAVVGTLVRSGQWLLRAAHCTAGKAVLACVELLLLWLLSAFVFLGLLPACIGFLWIVIDSFRG